MKNDDLITRGVVRVIPEDLAREKLASGKRLRIYNGIDPTGNKLHIGHTVQLRKLKAFSEAGHDVIFLIGSFTAMIGDPSGRDEARIPLTREQIEENFKTYKQQASKVLDFGKITVVYNHEWLEKLGGRELLKLASFFTKQQMEQRDMFVRREEEGKPIFINEFLYPLLQGYDSAHLDVDCELGATDQEFNMLAGRTLQKALGKREKFVLTTKIIEGTDGRKMSKTYDNCIYLEDLPDDMFGKVMSVRDELMATYFECCTDMPMDEVKKILKGNPRDAKARLAREIVTLYHGTGAADAAEKEFESVFKKGELPKNMPEATFNADDDFLQILIDKGLVSSKSEARRLVEQGGLTIDGTVIKEIQSDWGAEFAKHAFKDAYIVKVGKRKFLKIKFHEK
ncbi:tyrosine--tRNA ligase [Candidatus Peribacteria bacterium RIFOXYC2_FULL_55_14]|nr:MAG: Tyrosine-tRNA ligase [Candidatus Peribacteria bacterium GW2011_GWB1_54_5]OGJ72092.1 MAG: tyrosine--tRNA ligase [Candidatus Peribacteria bacterium RIFOXYA1_FULL_56_14]OGJ74106.1 MAG: tyrosine--tRNA ligase [Candidatus Peribacteria bacterium RIFOXYA2_FULL_55_28]OGJ75537.1 MAG: tyrosine--tRNA ligase [Candidatus Peribacteria bacterium RIFOXYB1_FULL_54_35]OGJ76287.1 MAG: tyrosine--tRNA ligase [Candidatus Peribacteria bacterium RIFOXYB2_FULL_54_17]OGJ78852.1 MAG: tyrosine--tRNA ligase [Candid